MASPANYVHRTGRSGRFGRRSVALTFVEQSTNEYMAEIKTYVAKRFKKEDIL